MDLWQLHIFCKVVESGSFSKAGDTVHLSQPTVSSHIKDLENHIGCRLIDRLPKNALPTKAGELLHSYAQRLLALRDEAETALAAFQGTIKGPLLIGGSTIPGVFILPKVIGGFSKEFPMVRVCLALGDTRTIIEDTLSGKLEVGVVGAKTEDSGLIQDPLLQDELRLVVPSGHPWSQKKQVSLAMVQKEPFISREPGSGTLKTIELSLEKKGYDINRFNIRAQMGSTEAIRQAVKNNIGVSILSSLAVNDDLEAGRLTAIEIKGVSFKRRFYLTRAKHRTPSPASRAFIDFLLSWKQVNGS
ncbi:MAG: selenium metabolism-associated LysR family transcriptional regulator [Desulfobacterales bacterium]|jgi:DNA-binding transcriptional LysR family regulator|nr:selenium metabolism-associated LysR family transcriptional regulator [Desulfobacterales bacterium]